MDKWQPIETAPEGELLLFFCPEAHRGGPSCEVLMFFRDADGSRGYWTNGGPNAGDDVYFEPSEEPTHWMPLPEPPAPPASTGV